MASWQDLREWTAARHALTAETESEFACMFDIAGWQRPLVLSRAQVNGEAWVLISAPVARTTNVTEALRVSSRSVIGALVFVEQQLAMRHAEPLARVTADALDALCREVVLGAIQVDSAARAMATTSPTFQHFAE